ncbi:hypothetical protein ACVWW1_009325 [Bradyrhizobium sp. JR3.5]
MRGHFRYGVRQQTESDSASADEAGGRQHAVAGLDRAGAASGEALQGARADLLARHDGRADRDRLRSRSGRRALRREALRQGGARLAAPGACGRRRRAVHRRHQGAELEQGAQHPDAAVRQPRHAVVSPEHGRYRRAAGQEMGAPQRRRGDRGRPRHDGADPRHHRAVRLRLPLQFVLPPRLPPVRGIAGALARDHHDDPRPAARGSVDAEAAQDARRRRRLHEQDGRRDHRRTSRQYRRDQRQEGHAGRDDDRRRSCHRRAARRRQHPLSDQHLPDRRPRDHQRPAVVHDLCAVEASRGAEEGL